MNLIDATLNIIIAKFDDCKPVCATKYLFKHQTCQEFKLVASELGGEATTKKLHVKGEKRARRRRRRDSAGERQRHGGREERQREMERDGEKSGENYWFEWCDLSTLIVKHFIFKEKTSKLVQSYILFYI